MTDTTAKLYWFAPNYTGLTTVTDYNLEVYPEVGNVRYRLLSSLGDVTNTLVTNLQRGSRYIFRVQAVNAVGAGAWSEFSVPIITANGTFIV